jgi:hypothetical protein
MPLFDLLLQIDPVPKVALPAEWAGWIIGTLIVVLLSFFTLVFKVAKMASNKTDTIVNKFELMHTQGMDRLDGIKDTTIRLETKHDLDMKEIKTEQKRQGDQISLLNSKVKCKEPEGA